MKTQPRWFINFHKPTFPKLTKNLSVDVAIIGAGSTGLTAAYLLKKAGVKVAVLERTTLGSGEIGNTTAHLTYITDPRLSELVRRFGKQNAQSVWTAGRHALDVIAKIVRDEKIDCDHARVPGYLHLPRNVPVDPKSNQRLQEEAALATEFGFSAEYIDSAPLVDRPAIHFPRQAQFHPLKYLAALANAVAGNGSHVFEHSEATEFTKDPFTIKANNHTLSCKYIVVATHVPILGQTNLLTGTLFQTKISGYSSYAIGAKLPKNSAAPACFWDTNDPYDYIRIDRQPTHDYIIYGGQDHKTGQESSAQDCFQRVQQKLLSLFPNAKLHARWSGQVIQTNDALPLIGEIVPGQFIATGFIGNGITFGTIAAAMARDAFLKRKNPFADLFDVRRKTVTSAWDYVKENVDFPFYLAKDRLTSAPSKSPATLRPGQGQVLKLNGQKVACSRDDHGKLHQVSATCTHMGCLVHWNDAEKTWDCPCHGSRFQPTGQVLAGPAETPLQPVKITRRKSKKKTSHGKDAPEKPHRPHRRQSQKGLHH